MTQATTRMELRLLLDGNITSSDDSSYPDGASTLTGDYNTVSIDPSYNSDGALPPVRDYKSGYFLIRYPQIQWPLDDSSYNSDGASALAGQQHYTSR